MNYYSHHIGDYTTDTAHLSLSEDGAYRRLMDRYYTTEGPLSNDEAGLFRLVRARSDEEKDAVRIVLQEFFQATDAGWVHKRCDAEIAAFKEKSMKAADAANKRWNKGGSTDAMPTHSEGNADALPTNNQEPITNNHKPVNLKPSSASPPEPYPEEFEMAWQAYPPRPGASKRDSYKAWAARRKEGVPAEALLAGVQRYANYVLLSRTEPQFTKQPATFFGPGEHYKADWVAGATQTQKGVIHGNFGKQDYHKGVGADGTF